MFSYTPPVSQMNRPCHFTIGFFLFFSNRVKKVKSQNDVRAKSVTFLFDEMEEKTFMDKTQ